MTRSEQNLIWQYRIGNYEGRTIIFVFCPLDLRDINFQHPKLPNTIYIVSSGKRDPTASVVIFYLIFFSAICILRTIEYNKGGPIVETATATYIILSINILRRLSTIII